MPVKPRPEGYHSITPYLVVRRAAGLLDFLKRAFGAVELLPATTSDAGEVVHAELRIGDSPVMVAEAGGPFQPMPATLYLYVDEDVDAVYRRAMDAGAASVRAPEDQFYGDRNAGVKDLSGNVWWISRHVEDVPPEELKRRMAALKK